MLARPHQGGRADVPRVADCIALAATWRWSDLPGMGASDAWDEEELGDTGRDLGVVYGPATFDDDGCHELGCNAKVGLRHIWPRVGQTKLTHHVNKETTLGFIWIAFVFCLCEDF